jgi:hypothetical protein
MGGIQTTLLFFEPFSYRKKKHSYLLILIFVGDYIEFGRNDFFFLSTGLLYKALENFFGF